MSTFLELKNIVANCLGRTDGGTADTLRDNAINNVIRFEIAEAYPFSWLERTTTVTTNASGQIDLPSDFNPAQKIKDARVV
jgi:hypothetical protein